MFWDQTACTAGTLSDKINTNAAQPKVPLFSQDFIMIKQSNNVIMMMALFRSYRKFVGLKGHIQF